MNFLHSIGMYILTTFFGYQSPAMIDLDYMRTTIMENHPGVYNNDDPLFIKNFETAYQEAKNALSLPVKRDEDLAILTTFTKSFNDTNLFLEWNNTQNSIKTKASITRKRAFHLYTIGDECVWITLPTFNISEEQKKDFNEILKQLPYFKNKKGIVFDIRGNQGGNSEYAASIVDALFGRQYAEQQRQKVMATTCVDWRASVDNKEYLVKLYQKYKSRSLQQIIDGMELSLKNGNPFYREQFVYGSRLDKKLTHDVAATIFVIIDSQNTSAALDFLDELFIMEPKKYILIGEKTGADRFYMEVRTVLLPSGSGVFSFPIKVYKNRLRADNESYFPDIVCKVNDSPALQELVIKKLHQE